MVNFKQLFAFSTREVQFSFSFAAFLAGILGLRLLRAPLFYKEQSYGKLLIIIPKRSGKAHERNKLRRQIKAAFYENKLFEKPITSVLLVYHQAKKLSYEEIKEFLCKNINT
jgi:ribonuclease P protein component